MRLKIGYHDNCFDGCASAAVFARFFEEKISPGAELHFQGLAHGAGDPFAGLVLDADQHAIVDFRYTQKAGLHWFFDHHVSAFQEPGDEAHFRADDSGRKHWDPHAKSCTKFLARVATERFGFDATPLAELVEWAEIIDGASFPSAAMAVELEEPALRLMTLLEAEREPAFVHAIIRRFMREPLAAIAASPEVQDRLAPLLQKHRRAVELVRARATMEDGVVFFDLTDVGLDAVNKFIPYYLFPDCRYSVNVTAGPKRAKVSIGSSPWAKVPRTHDLAKIAERFGGGGHPVVAAVSLAPHDVAKAKQVASEVVAELRRG